LDSIWFPLLLQVVLIALNAVFACAEIAVISVNDAKLAKLIADGDKRAIRLGRLTSQPARFLATIQVAITLSGFLGSAFAADNFSDPLVETLIGWGVKIPENTLNSIAVIVITLILSYFTLILGELVPKRVAMKKAEKLALGMSAFITVISRLFAPIVWFLTVSTNGVLRVMGIDPNAEEENVSEEEIRMMVDVGSEKGVIDDDEKLMIQNVFEFDDLTAGEIATHRTEMVVLWLEDDMEQWEQVIRENRHSLYPICDKDVDDIVGVLSIKDYFRLDDHSRETVMKEAVRSANFVPDSIKADVLFQRMQQSRNHFSVVSDEYGGVLGIVTMNDLLEQLVGDLDDGEVAQPPEIECVSGNTWRVDGAADLDEVAERLGVSLPEDTYDTFGGYVFGEYGAIPADGSSIRLETEELIVEVTEIREHRMENALVTVKEKPDIEAD
jgi:putative hemolysin